MFVKALTPLRELFEKNRPHHRLTPTQAMWKGMRLGTDGALLGLPFIALETGLAQRGEVLPTATARTAGLVTYPAISGLMAAGLTLAFPGLRFAGFLGGVAAMYPDALVQDSLLRGLKTVTAAARNLRQLQVGGSYRDTEFAQMARLRALTEMSGALGASRRYLGQEAALMHR
jgi:hypothetical protein